MGASRSTPGIGSSTTRRAARRKAAQEAKVQVEITLIDGTLFPHRGVLDFVDVAISPQTGTALVRASIPNPDEVLKPGQFVRARLLGWERPDALLVPQRAVIQQPTGQFIYVVGEGDKAELRAITTGQWFNDGWVIESGLKPGDRVIVDALMQVRPGAPVKPVAAAAL